ncbi:3-isopropylmalate dehydrogenase [Polaribacter litorisediminis]|uniref:3-isopropylmalate dehydrogenase n=1 Tax=Polaribacter litorisediminis TaxID=1908341 RepID=UPI001CBD4788|nr:3-isopropylmalate dehydrogenase [Polaribacter litorisediminis]UAM97513.1 3-isopropylmalate dehydrogenase [Polaribacter litorisediminis]
MKYTIAVIPGDGIGPEVTDQAKKALDAVAEAYDHIFLYKEAQMGACAIEASGDPLPEETVKICRAADAILFGAIGDPKYDNNPSAKVRPEQGLFRLRKELDLYCNVRPVKAYDNLISNSPLKREVVKGTDFVIFRELTGGIYFGKKELSADKKEAFDISSYTVDQISRITHLAFKSAQERNKKVTLIDKSNVLETSRLWRKTVTEIAKEYKNVTLEYLYVDHAAMKLILDPKQFDVILTENLFGDIISDGASAICGTIGLLASSSIGDENALFEPIHGAYPEAAGKNYANPLAAILAVAMLLKYLGLHEEADAVERAVEKSITLGITTKDIKRKTQFSASTSKVGDFIADYITNQDDSNMNFTNIHMGQSTII